MFWLVHQLTDVDVYVMTYCKLVTASYPLVPEVASVFVDPRVKTSASLANVNFFALLVLHHLYAELSRSARWRLVVTKSWCQLHNFLPLISLKDFIGQSGASAPLVSPSLKYAPTKLVQFFLCETECFITCFIVRKSILNPLYVC